MIYTVHFRDEQGKEVTITELVATDILHSTVFVCPRERRLTNIDAELLRDCFQKAGVAAIICSEPVTLYQLKSHEEQPE